MPVLLSFWGKGGVGKTTLSSAVAIKLAEEGYRVYLLSTDFVPSLPDVLGCDLSGSPRKVCGEVIAEQLTEDVIIELWKQRFGDEVYKVASSIFPVGPEIIEYVARAPGIVEEFTLYYIWDKFYNMDADFLVWDTMATGGGIRMLRIEKEFYDHLGEAAKLYLKVKGVIDRVRRGEKEPLELIESWRQLADSIFQFLKSKDHRAILVSRPLPVDFSVARKIYYELREYDFPLRVLMINMIQRSEHNVLSTFMEGFSDKINLITVPQAFHPPVGCEALRTLIPNEQWATLLKILEE